MNTAQLDWACQHMGHTMDVHKLHYRARSDVLERIEIAKILLIQDLGVVDKYIGKKLEDIQFEGILYCRCVFPSCCGINI